MHSFNQIRRLVVAAMLFAAIALSGCQGAPEEKPAPKKLSFTGFIKGAPAAGSFVVSSTTATYTVNMSKSTFERDGSPVSASSIKDGSFVTVRGTVEGSTLTATSIRLIKDPGEAIEKPVPVSAG